MSQAGFRQIDDLDRIFGESRPQFHSFLETFSEVLVINVALLAAGQFGDWFCIGEELEAPSARAGHLDYEWAGGCAVLLQTE